MIQVSTIRLAVAKRVFQVHGENAAGAVVLGPSVAFFPLHGGRRPHMTGAARALVTVRTAPCTIGLAPRQPCRGALAQGDPDDGRTCAAHR